MKTISSRHNPLVALFRDAAREPDIEGTRLLLDGVHLVRDAHAAHLAFDIVAITGSRWESDSEEGRLARELDRDGVDVVAASDHVFGALSPVRQPSGIVAIARRTRTTVGEVLSSPSPFVIAVVDVQDPGNLGSIVRSAEASGATGLLVCGQSANPFSWKALRGSMGSALRMPIVANLSPDMALSSMRQRRMTRIAAVPRDGADPDDIDWRGAAGLFLGGEGPGLNESIIGGCDALVTIPMATTVESLNVAAAASILVYAARRQRIDTLQRRLLSRS